MRILAFAWKYDQDRGSEFVISAGWVAAWAAAGHAVTVLTGPDARPASGTTTSIGTGTIAIHHLDYPRWISRRGPIFRYLWWQRMAMRRARRMHADCPFDLGHHLSAANMGLGTSLYKTSIPYVFGPVGGGQIAPTAYRPWFGCHWTTERIRGLCVTHIIPRIPWSRKSTNCAEIVLCANRESVVLARRLGGRKVVQEVDALLPSSFRLLGSRSRSRELRILWVGRTFPRKGLRFALEALAQVDPDIPWRLTVLGGGPLAGEAPRWISTLGISKRVDLRGQVPWQNVQESYRNHDVFLFTSLRDSGPSQLMEAMAMGLPVITLDLHGQGVLVASDRGFAVPAKNPRAAKAAIAMAIATLHRDRDMLKRLSESAVAYADAHSGIKKLDRLLNAMAL